MGKSRRDFLKIAGISALGLGANPILDLALGLPAANAQVFTADVGEYQRSEGALHAEHWGMAIFTRKFEYPEDFQVCIDACHTTHNVPEIEGNEEIKWLWTDTFHHTFPEKEQHYQSAEIENKDFLLLCNHCENPPCVRVCPTKATFKREEDGLVLMDFHRCIGCRFCMAACPYGARSFNFSDPRNKIKDIDPTFPTRMRGVVEKCNFCAERLSKGLMPACVEASEGRMIFGDLSDPDSEIRHALHENFSIRRKASLGTQPSVYYII
jgi:molybdopterin-containing oxidoreductase family iron-sulfur binding subunit